MILRHLLPLLVTLFPAVTGHAFTPSRPIEIVVHGPANSGTETYAKLVVSLLTAEKLLPQPVTIVNRTRGSGIEAMEYLVANKGADHLLAVFTPSWIAGPLTGKDARITITDVTPIARLDLEPTLVVVRADAPWKSIRDLADAARESGRIRQAGGPETALEALNGQLLQHATGTKWTYVRMTSAKARIGELQAGKIDVLVPSPQDVKAGIAAGRLRAIAAIAERRLAALPDVPTLKEQGIDVPILANMRGLVAPPGLSPDAAAYWEGLFERMVATPAWKAYLAENQMENAFMKGSALTPFFAEQIALTRKVLTLAGVAVVR